MLVKDLMSTNVITVNPTTKVSEVADILHSHGFIGVPVLNTDGTVVGLITEQELFSADSKLYFPGYIKILQETKFVIGGHKELPYAAEQFTRIVAKDIMNQKVFFAHPDMPMEELAAAFVRENQSPIPVTDATNKLLGIISRSDLVKLLIPEDKAGLIQGPADKQRPVRPIDEELTYVHKDLSSRFAYVAKARANIWLTMAIVLFVVGFLIGVIYVANPAIIGIKSGGGTTTIDPLNTNIDFNQMPDYVPDSLDLPVDYPTR